MSAHQRECPSEQISASPSLNHQSISDLDQPLDNQENTAFQNWINQVQQQYQSDPEFEAWAHQVKVQMLQSLRKQMAS